MNIIRKGDNMNIIDIAVFFIIIACGLIGFRKGFFSQLVSTVGVILVFVLAFYLKNPIAEFLSLNLPFFKFGGVFSNVTSLNIILYQLIAFLIMLILLGAVLRILITVTGIVEKLLKITIILGIPSKILGLILGLIEGVVVVYVCLFFLKQPAFNIDVVKESQVANNLLGKSPLLSNVSNGFVETFDDVYNLFENKKNMTPTEANLESIDVMLKHKVVTPKYISTLVDHDKLRVVGIDNVLNKYR